MNYSLYPDILSSHTNPFQKEEINNKDDVLTNSKVNILDDMSVYDPSEKLIMKRFISAVSKNISKSNSREVSNLIEGHPLIEDNIVKAASILFFSIGHSSFLHNKNIEETVTEKDSEDLDYDDGSDSDSSCNSETECYYCGYYPIRNGIKKHKFKCEKSKKTLRKTINNNTRNNKTLNFGYYEALKNNDPLNCIKDEFINNNKINNDDVMMNDNDIMDIDDSDNYDNMEDASQSKKIKMNIKRKKDIKINANNLNLLNYNNKLNNSTLYFSNKNIMTSSTSMNNHNNINSRNNNNLSNINNSNDLMIPQTMNATNSSGFSSMPYRKIKCKADTSPTTTAYINSTFNSNMKDKVKVNKSSSSSSSSSSNSKTSKQSNNKNKGEKVTPHDLINGIRFFHLQPSNDPNARKYLCSFPGCTSAFQRKYNCRSHYSSVHLQLRPYHCDCGINFTRKYDLYRHDSMVHRRGPMVKNFNNKNKNSNKGNNKTSNNSNSKSNNSKNNNNNTTTTNKGNLNSSQHNKMIPSVASNSINNTTLEMTSDSYYEKHYTNAMESKMNCFLREEGNSHHKNNENNSIKAI